MRTDVSNLTWGGAHAEGGGDAALATPWPQWLAQAGAEVAQPLTAAFDRLKALAHAERIERSELGAVVRDLERARRAAVTVQQLARFAGGAVGQFPEPVDLAALLGDVVGERKAAAQARGVPLVESLPPVTVVADPALLHSLLHALLDWAVEHSASAIHVAVGSAATPARLNLHFRPRATTLRAAGREAVAANGVDTLQWHLLRRLSGLLELPLARTDGGDGCIVTIDFPRTVTRQVAPGSGARAADDAARGTLSKPLAGHHVLVVCARRALRHDLCESIRHMGLMIDAVASVEEARAFCAEGLPHAVVADALVGSERLWSLQRELAAQAPGLPVIEVADDARGYEPASPDRTRLACVGRGSLGDGLPAALMFELTREA